MIPIYGVAAYLDGQYRKDFSTADSRKKFEELMERAHVVLTLRNQSLEEEYADVRANADALKKARRQAYQDVGRFVVDHCDILVAIWDEQPARGKGGTADTVAYARQTGCPVYTINPDSPEAFGYFSDADENRQLRRLDRCHGAICEFNRRLKASGGYHTYAGNLYRDLFESPPDAINNAIAEDAKNAVKNRLMPYYAVASVTAKWYRKIYRYVGLTAFWLVLTAVSRSASARFFFIPSPFSFSSKAASLLPSAS